MASRYEDETTEDEENEIVVSSHGEAVDKKVPIRGERIEFSDEDGDEAYQKFKARKATKRKRIVAGKRRAADNITKDRSVKRAKRAQNGEEKKVKEEQVWGDDSDNDVLMEYTLPDYLKTRRAAFDKRKEKLLQAGLKLPPEYDEVYFSDDERLRDLEERPSFPTATPCRKYEDIQLPYSLGLIPAPIAQWLREYQVQGTSFLHELFVYQRGGILGDDMGLGKTVQVIAFLTAAYGKTADERDGKRLRKMRRQRDEKWYPRTLIICPGTLIQNWKNEFDRWGWWHVDVYIGSEKEAALDTAKSGMTEVMITTYTTYRLNLGAINMIEWDCVVADECHQIKGKDTETTKAMNEVNALCRIGLTGTAIQNNYDELWTLLNWTNPGQFGPLSTWKKSISLPLKIGQSHDTTNYELSQARKTAKKLVENLLPPFFLRRMKTLIKDQLPKKTDRVVFCPLTNTQADAYENFLHSDIVQTIKRSSEICDCRSNEKRKRGWCCYATVHAEDQSDTGEKWQKFVFPAIISLQKISNHLAILIPQGTDPRYKQAKDLEMLQITVPDQWEHLFRNRDSIINYANPEFCGKWRILNKLLEFWHGNGDKVLVFSHNVRLLKMLQMLFNHTSYNVSYLDGAMKYEDRAQAVDDFNSDPRQFVFLISTKAGGVGLNITSANKVVVVDPNWNPAYDLQAQDRAYRIGQVRDVEVFRLVSAGTIEEIVYARQIYKQQQANVGYNASTERRYFRGVQDKKDQKGEIFGLSNLFEYQNNNVVLREIVNKTNVAESKVGVSVVDFEMGDNDEDSDDDLFNSQGTADPDDPDSAISQLAALVKGEEDGSKKKKKKLKKATKKTDPVQAILSGAGVEYTHENSEVIGSSKVEAQLSRRAEEDTGLGMESVFANEDNDMISEEKLPTYVGQDGVRRPIRYKFSPPADVMKRQFCSMAKRHGFKDVVEFALVVESMTQEERRRVLDRWYKERRDILANSGTPEGSTPKRDEDVKFKPEPS